MGAYGSVRDGLWAHYQGLLGRTDELSYVVDLLDGWGRKVGETTIVPCGLEDELGFTKRGIELWRRYEREAERR